MSEFQKCQRCGNVFAQIDRTGPSIGGISEIMRHVDEKECPSCGGPVIWVDDRGYPMNAYRRMKEANLSMIVGCLGVLVALIVILILHYFVLR